MLLQTMFPTGVYADGGRSYMVKSGDYYKAVATSDGATWSLTAFGQTTLASGGGGDVLKEFSSTAYGAGTTNDAAVSAVEYGADQIVHRTVLTITALSQTIVNTTSEYKGTLIYTFPEGRILLLGSVSSLTQTTTSTLASTITSGSTGAFALGSTAASNTTLTGTMVDMLASTAYTSSTSKDVAGSVFKGKLTTSAQFDGTTTPQPVYFNTAIATNSADGTQTFSGTISLVWVNIGDY